MVTSVTNATNCIKNDTLLKPSQIIDSLVFSEKLDWSVRLVSNFKQQQSTLKNNKNKLQYKPNNPYGFGIGIANQKLVIDIVFNLKTEKEALQTNKFAAEGALVLKKNFIGFILENVHGYNVTSTINNATSFRKDMSIFSLGINYLHLFKNEYFTIRMMKSGLTPHEKTSVSLGIGGFFIINKISSDGTIVPIDSNPYFNDESEITRYNANGVGVLAGIATYFDLPANFFLALSVSPGIGLEYKKISTKTEKYVPKNPLIYKLDLFTGLGYKGKKCYVHFNFGTNIYASDLDFNNKTLLSVTKSKLIFGYNIGKINFRPKKQLF